MLFDRHGDVLVDNQSMFNIAVVREQTGNLDTTLRVLSEATGVPEAQLREMLAAYVDQSRNSSLVDSWVSRLTARRSHKEKR